MTFEHLKKLIDSDLKDIVDICEAEMIEELLFRLNCWLMCCIVLCLNSLHSVNHA